MCDLTIRVPSANNALEMLEGTCEKLGYCWNTLRATTDELPK
jgi:hypothetical protein